MLVVMSRVVVVFVDVSEKLAILFETPRYVCRYHCVRSIVNIHGFLTGYTHCCYIIH